jgi:tetratricopeptide (TPR) repeat protein
VPIDRAAILRSAEKLLQQGKLESAIAEYRRIVDEQPEDWTTANILGDLYVRAGHNDQAVEQFVRIANHLQRQGFLPKAAALYKKVLRIRPDDDHAMTQAGEIAASQGLLVDASVYLTSASERRSARGDHRGAAEIRVRLGSLDVKDVEARRHAAYARIDLGDVAGALSDFKAISKDLTRKGRGKEAAQLLTDVLKIYPDDVEMRQLLFDTLISCGDIQGARELATTAEQFRALAAAVERQRGAADVPEHPIESTSTRQSTPAESSEPSLPVDMTDELPENPPASIDQISRDAAQFEEEVVLIDTTQGTLKEEPASDRVSATEPDRFELSVPSADLNLDEAVGDIERWLDEHDPQKAEVDLTVVLDAVKSQGPPQLARRTKDETSGEDLDIDQVFAQLRDKAGGASEAAEQEYGRGVALYQAGQVTEGIRALEAASRAPIHRFRAAAALGRIYRDSGALSQAIEWFERAAGAPAPSAEDGHALFYELAASLESMGEVERALAVCLELQAEAGDYRDLSACISRLTKAQARG